LARSLFDFESPKQLGLLQGRLPSVELTPETKRSVIHVSSSRERPVVRERASAYTSLPLATAGRGRADKGVKDDSYLSLDDEDMEKVLDLKREQSEREDQREQGERQRGGMDELGQRGEGGEGGEGGERGERGEKSGFSCSPTPPIARMKELQGRKALPAGGADGPVASPEGNLVQDATSTATAPPDPSASVVRAASSLRQGSVIENDVEGLCEILNQ